MKIIDPHLHLFNLSEGEYAWLQPDKPPFWPDKQIINREFSQADLQLPEQLQLTGLVHIEAGFDNHQPGREIAWLESCLNLPFRSIASADLTTSSQAFSALLDELESYPSVAGVRHILDDQAASLLANPQVIHNLQQLAERGLIFDCQYSLTDTYATQLLAAFLDTQPLQTVINHAGFPPLAAEAGKIWQENLTRLADYPQVSIKASGWEMTDRNYPETMISQILEQLLQSFGTRRVMLASNFPLCNFSTSYEDLWQTYSELPFTPEVLEQLCYQNTKRIYKL